MNEQHTGACETRRETQFSIWTENLSQAADRAMGTTKQLKSRLESQVLSQADPDPDDPGRAAHASEPLTNAAAMLQSAASILHDIANTNEDTLRRLEI